MALRAATIIIHSWRNSRKNRPVLDMDSGLFYNKCVTLVYQEAFKLPTGERTVHETYKNNMHTGPGQ